MRSVRRGVWRQPAAWLAGSWVLAGCAGPAPSPSLRELPEIAPWSWFDEPTADDPWILPISSWQERAQAGDAAEAQPPAANERPVSNVLIGGRAAFALSAPGRAVREPATSSRGDLARSWHSFRAEKRRDLVRALAGWIQEQAADHFRPDVVIDHWPTFDEVLARGADDCDGLALLVFQLLRDFGFEQGELYQAIVQNDDDAQLHMVTLWFEQPEDPWVIDPTAAMVDRMVRMSEVEGWRPLELFTETEHFAVRDRTLPAVAAPPPDASPQP